MSARPSQAVGDVAGVLLSVASTRSEPFDAQPKSTKIAGVRKAERARIMAWPSAFQQSAYLAAFAQPS